MEFRVIGQTAEGESVDEVMDGQSGQLLRRHLEEAGIEVMSVRRIRPPKNDSERVEQSISASVEDQYVLLLTLFGAVFNLFATFGSFAAFVSLRHLPLSMFLFTFAIFFLIAGFGCWILAAIRTTAFALVHASNRTDVKGPRTQEP